MCSVKDSDYYREAIQEIDYPFGTLYLFEYFIVAEIKEGMLLSWEDHGKNVVEHLADLYDQKGKDLVVISNRINNYSIQPTEWLKFFKSEYKLKAYVVVSYSEKGYLNTLLEKLFVKTNFKRFRSFENAVEWVKEFQSSATRAS